MSKQPDAVPLVSVLVCTYNHAKFVAETLDSVLAQHYPNMQVVVGDDGSTDRTPDIISDYAARHPSIVHPILHPANSGIAANINRTLRLASGSYLAWLDGDDQMLPGKIEAQVDYLERNEHDLGCYHDLEVFDSESNRNMGRFSTLYNGTTHLESGQIDRWMRPRYYLLSSGIMARKEAVPSWGYDERLKYMSDVLFFAETFQAGTLGAIPRVLGRYRRHHSNLTNANSPARPIMHEHELLVYSVLQARYPKQHATWRKLRRSAMLVEAMHQLRAGDKNRFAYAVSSALAEGAVLQALTLKVAAPVLARSITRNLNDHPTTRARWKTLLSRWLLAAT